MPAVYVSAGSNLERHASLRHGVAALHAAFGDLVLSPVYESESQGFSGPAFLNLVIRFDSELPVPEIAQTLADIERSAGRKESDRGMASRTLDLDMLLYGDTVGTFGRVQLPRDEIERYAFVLRPLADIAADELYPLTGVTFAGMWEAFEQARQPLHVYDLDLAADTGWVVTHQSGQSSISRSGDTT